MSLAQIIMIWGLLSGSLFTIQAVAQEIVIKGDQKNPHQPPVWFSRMANSEKSNYVLDSDSFRIGEPSESHFVGRPRYVSPKIACKKTDTQGVERWAFCEL